MPSEVAYKNALLHFVPVFLPPRLPVKFPPELDYITPLNRPVKLDF